MTPTTLKLDWLPREILRQIVTLGSCETVLALSQVSKRLQQFCDDPGLYKSIVENHRGHEVATWYSTTLSMESPISTWARYALADVKAAQWSFDRPYIPILYGKRRLELDTIARFRDIGSWGPQLMVSCHPFIDIINTRTIFRFLSYNWPASRDEHEVRYALAFCLVIVILDKSPMLLDWWRYRADVWLRRRRDNWHNYWDKMLPELRHSRDASSFGDSFNDEQHNNKVTTETRHRVLIALALFSQAFHERYKDHPNIELFPLPSSRNIPFILMMNLSPPLSLNGAGGFATCHLSKMTTKEFFEDGLWNVCPSNSVGIRMTFVVPVRGIQFIGTQSKAHPSKLSLCGSRSDRGGDFTLEGSVAHETGRVHLAKWSIRSTHVTYLSGLMTPFGIFGVHNSSRQLSGGWFWLWKDAWTR